MSGVGSGEVDLFAPEKAPRPDDGRSGGFMRVIQVAEDAFALFSEAGGTREEFTALPEERLEPWINEARLMRFLKEPRT